MITINIDKRYIYCKIKDPHEAYYLLLRVWFSWKLLTKFAFPIRAHFTAKALQGKAPGDVSLFSLRGGGQKVVAITTIEGWHLERA